MRVLRSIFVGVVCGSAALSFACGGSDSSGSPATDGGGADSTQSGDGGGPPSDSGPINAGSLAAFCDGVYGTVTRTFEGCCNAQDQTTFQFKLADALLKVLLGLCETELPTSLSQGRIQYDVGNGSACVAAVQQAYAGYTCNGSFPSSTVSTTACGAAIVGLQAAGAPCADDYECQDGLTCVGYVHQKAGSVDGVCSQPPASGQTCGPGKADGGGTTIVHWNFGAHPQCATGSYCPSSGTCAAQAGSGGNCAADNECVSGLTCHMDKCGTTGPAAAGGACLSEKDCQAGLYCGRVDGGANACTPKLPAGSPCTGALGSTCKGVCDVPDGGGNNGTCATFCGSG
jgi:hypothetical protein